MFGLILPILLLIFAVGAGAYAIGGSEEDGTLELLLSNPVTRGRVLIERLVAVVALSLGLGIVTTASLLAFSPPFGLLEGVSIPRLVAAVFAATAFGLMHGAIAFAAGAWTGRRSVAIATAATVAVIGNLLNAVAASSESLHILRFASPWHWYGAATCSRRESRSSRSSLRLPLSWSARRWPCGAFDGGTCTDRPHVE